MPSAKALYPAFLNLSGADVLVVGGGDVAARKVGSLLDAGARVTVVASTVHVELARVIRSKKNVRVLRRAFKLADLRGRTLVFAATHDLELNQRIAAACKARGIFVNAAAPQEAGTLQVPSSIHRGPLCIAFSTGGASAALAKTLRIRAEAAFGPEWGQLAALLQARRKKILSRIPDAARRHDLLHELGQPRWAELIRKKGVRTAARSIDLLIDKTVHSCDNLGSSKYEVRSSK